ncbi:MAG: metallophosphoesterase family protein [Planctomycetota bacterium]|jgi:diadenosine tetraphosphatase ApaH/serine/threonine PP2A family protein phosphatase|nr:metallophosphoesterase family protein [Planctomycetota bacterium]
MSDVHANIEAFERLVIDLDERGIEKILCLGDVIGYGPNPVECLDLALSLIASGRLQVILLGNHEEAVLSGPFGFNPIAKEAVDWTRAQLKPRWNSLTRTKSRWEALRNFPLTYCEDGVLFVHGSPRDPTMEYILRSDTEDLFGEVPEKISKIFGLFESLCFVGHTHDPGVITEESQFLRPSDFGMVFEVAPGARYVVNVGSVGQPRDRDNRSCYATYDGVRLEYHRLEYDYGKTVEKIRRIPELDNRNAERLELGN